MIPQTDPIAIAAREAWEKKSGRKAGPDDYYDSDLERFIAYATEEEMEQLRASAGGALIVDREDDYRFASSSLPYDYPYHKGPWGPPDERGRRQVRFENQAQVRDTLARAKAAGEPLAYAGRRFNVYCDDVVKG